MGGLVGIWQGTYGPDGTLQSSGAGQPSWAPTPGSTYLVIAQSSAVSGGSDYSAGVKFTLACSAYAIANQQSEAKVSSHGPTTAPMVFLQWQCPLGWGNGNVTISADAIGHDGSLNDSCYFAIVVVEIEQPVPAA